LLARQRLRQILRHPSLPYWSSASFTSFFDGCDAALGCLQLAISFRDSSAALADHVRRASSHRRLCSPETSPPLVGAMLVPGAPYTEDGLDDGKAIAFTAPARTCPTCSLLGVIVARGAALRLSASQ